MQQIVLAEYPQAIDQAAERGGAPGGGQQELQQPPRRPHVVQGAVAALHRDAQVAYQVGQAVPPTVRSLDSHLTGREDTNKLYRNIDTWGRTATFAPMGIR